MIKTPERLKINNSLKSWALTDLNLGPLCTRQVL